MSEDYEARAHKQLQIESWSNAARTLLVRGATDGGPFAEQHVTNADKSRATDTFELHGRPTKLQISPSTAPVRRGECYVRVTLLLDGEPVQRLAAAYLTDSKTLSWPPGQFEAFTEGPGLIRVITGTDPAAGVEVVETVPTNTRWVLRGLRIGLTSDATVINRVVRLQLDDGANVFHQVPDIAVQPASSGYAYHYSLGGESRRGVGDNAILSHLLPQLQLFQGYRFATSTGSLQAGDNYTAPIYEVEEWIEE